MTTFPTLYKRTKTGAKQQWTIYVKGNTFYTIEGLVDGKLTTSKPTFCSGKNIGRSNETAAEEQAKKEAQAKWDRKVEKNYTTDINKIDNVNMYYEPMLAHKFENYKHKIHYPVITQRKSDGIRAIITENCAMSRNGKQHKTVDHILKALQPFFKKYPDAILDGELYSHRLHDDFNKITSLIRKQKPTKLQLEESKNIVEFHCYDVPRIGKYNENDLFSKRYELMQAELKKDKYKKVIKVVENIECKSEEEVKKQHDIFVSKGYEGIIIRIDGPYYNKRTKNLLKYKIFETEEYILLDIREGKGNKKGLAAHADFKTNEGKRFTANIKGTTEWRKKLLKEKKTNKNNIIGKQATVKYFNLTPDNLPRFPYLIAIRDYE